jgi:hypothetical protein
MDEDDLAAERVRLQEPKREVDRSIPIYERVQRRADEIEATMRAAGAAFARARMRFSKEFERCRKLECDIMEADLKMLPSTDKFCQWLDARKELGRCRQEMRAASDVLTERRRHFALFSGAACELAMAQNQQARMEDYLL